MELSLVSTLRLEQLLLPEDTKSDRLIVASVASFQVESVLEVLLADRFIACLNRVSHDWSSVRRVFAFEPNVRLCHLHAINTESPNTCSSSTVCTTTRKCSLLVVAEDSAGCFVSVLELSPTSDALQRGSSEWSERTHVRTPDELQGWWLSSALLSSDSVLLSCDGSRLALEYAFGALTASPRQHTLPYRLVHRPNTDSRRPTLTLHAAPARHKRAALDNLSAANCWRASPTAQCEFSRRPARRTQSKTSEGRYRSRPPCASHPSMASECGPSASPASFASAPQHRPPPSASASAIAISSQWRCANVRAPATRAWSPSHLMERRVARARLAASRRRNSQHNEIW